MRRFLYFFPFVFLSMIIASCSSDPSDPSDPSEEEGISGSGNPTGRVVVDFDDLSYFQNSITEVDSKGEFLNRPIGYIAHDDTPQELYIGVESLDEAKSMFHEWLAPDVQVKSTAVELSAKLTDVDGNAQGTIFFKYSQGSSHIADVKFSADTNLRYFNSLSFVSNSTWSANDGAKKFHKGDVITHVPNPNYVTLNDADKKLKWICIRESGNGIKPIFCTVTSDKYESGSELYNSIKNSMYCAKEPQAMLISNTLRSNWDFWNPIFTEQGIPLDRDENYWIDMTQQDFGALYYETINLPSGVMYGFPEKIRKPFLLKIDWLDDDEIYSCLNGTDGTTQKETESYDRLFDGVNDTKWYSYTTDGKWYVEFNGNTALKPVGYKLTTASDAEKFRDRNPKAWRLLARNNEEEEWTEIAKETDGGLPYIDGYTKSYPISNPKTYMYYRWEISETTGDKNRMHISRFSFVL